MALRWASLSLVFMSPLAWSADLTIPNTFVPGTPATAATVNENFSATATAVNSKQDLVTGTCPSGSAIRAVNSNGTVICQQLSTFGGDGSAGDLTVSASQNWGTNPPVNPNFANVTINAGQTLTVPAGTTILCSGNFVNNGAILVLPGASGINKGFSASVSALVFPASPGDAYTAASPPDWHSSYLTLDVNAEGGFGGVGIPRTAAVSNFERMRIGGGSGSGWANINAEGGGLVRIYCGGDIINNGTISANGESPGTAAGGGGGGIIILAALGAVNNAGTVSAVGGAGGAPGSGGFSGRGGGGGGGIVLLIAPTLTPGTVNVSGGAASTATPAFGARDTRVGGGGGGASGGNGGKGGSVSNSSVGAAIDGAVGYVVGVAVSPATLR